MHFNKNTFPLYLLIAVLSAVIIALASRVWLLEMRLDGVEEQKNAILAAERFQKLPLEERKKILEHNRAMLDANQVRLRR